MLKESVIALVRFLTTYIRFRTLQDRFHQPRGHSRTPRDCFLAHRARLLAAAGVAFGLAMTAAGLTEDVVDAETLPWDRAVMLGVHQYLLAPGLVQVMRWITFMGTTPFIGLLGLALFLYLGRRQDRAGQKATLVGLGGSAVLILGLKHWIQRPRPELFTHLVTAGGYSFPSGHSLAAVVAYGLLITFMAQQVKHRFARVLLGIAGVLLVALIGFSRIYLGVHYPSDVLGGYCIGAAWLTLVIAGYSWFHRSQAVHAVDTGAGTAF